VEPRHRDARVPATATTGAEASPSAVGGGRQCGCPRRPTLCAAKNRGQHAAQTCGVASIEEADGVALRSGAEAGVDRRSPPARRGLNLQTAGGSYSPWGVGTAREEEKENPISLAILLISHSII
jgi:hypothetical protein